MGEYSQEKEGPLFIFIGGIHGNEPAGVEALKRIFATLEKLQPSFNGKIVGLCGNCAALAVRQRYMVKDLNRLWSKEEISRVMNMDGKDRNPEERQLLELIEIIDYYLEKPHTQHILIDLHTTSAPGGLFSIVSDDPFNIDLATALHTPVIFDLMPSLSTTTNMFIQDRGIKGIAFESGQHDDPQAIDLHEAAIWLMLEKMGCIHAQEIPFLDSCHEKLITTSRHLPHHVRVVYRHEIEPEHQFKMYPGYVNFHKVYQGEALARDKEGPISCPRSGMILMPLYQPQGEEGFFIIEGIED